MTVRIKPMRLEKRPAPATETPQDHQVTKAALASEASGQRGGLCSAPRRTLALTGLVRTRATRSSIRPHADHAPSYVNCLRCT